MTAIDMLGQMMQSNRGLLLAMVADLDGPALVYRPAGGQGNHPLWLLGHVANSEAHLAGWAGIEVGVPPVGDPARFAIRSVPVADASAYPTKQQLLDYAAAVREQVLAGLSRLTPSDLARPSNAPPHVRDYFDTVGKVLQTLATHEMMHVGQLSVVRKELGLGPVIG